MRYQVSSDSSTGEELLAHTGQDQTAAGNQEGADENRMCGHVSGEHV